MTTRDGTMNNVYLINEIVLFEPERRRLGPLAGYPHRAATLHGPVSECLLLLLQNNNEVVTQRVLFASVWEKQGTVVSTNALYQTISQLRKVLKSAGIEEDIIKTLPKTGFKSTAQLQEAALDAFITVQKTSLVVLSSEESVEPVKVEPVVVIPEEQPRKPFFFNSTLAYALSGILFLISCSILYSILNEGKTEFENYQPVGKFNGCDVYSSWHDKEKSGEKFMSLSKRYPIQCQKGGTAWMTINFAHQGNSVIVCDRHPQEIDAQCDSILYRQESDDE